MAPLEERERGPLSSDFLCFPLYLKITPPGNFSTYLNINDFLYFQTYDPADYQLSMPCGGERKRKPNPCFEKHFLCICFSRPSWWFNTKSQYWPLHGLLGLESIDTPIWALLWCRMQDAGLSHVEEREGRRPAYPYVRPFRLSSGTFMLHRDIDAHKVLECHNHTDP